MKKRRLLPMLLTLSVLLALMPAKALAVESGTEFREPTVTSLTVTYRDEDHSEKTVSLLPLDSGLEPVTAASPSTFRVEFDSLDRLDKVYITSTTAGGTKYLEAAYDTASGAYTTSGYFDPDDTGYVPGTIGVSYTKKVVAVTEETDVAPDIDLNALETRLKDEGVTLERLPGSDGGASVQAQVVLGALGSGAADVAVNALVSTFADGIGAERGELERWLGVYRDLESLPCSHLKGTDGGEYILYLDDGEISDTDTWLLLVKDVTENTYTKLLLTRAAGSLDDIADSLEQANTVSKMLLEYASISGDMDALRRDVDASTMTDFQKSAAYTKINALEQDKKLFLMGTTVLPLFVGVTAITGGAALSAAPALLFSALMGGITSASSYFWENRIGMIRGCEPVEGMFAGGNPYGSGWTALTMSYLEEESGILPSGKYYLAEDLNYSGLNTLAIGHWEDNDSPADVTLCLNGHEVYQIYIYGNGHLHLCDCAYAEREGGAVSGGKVECVLNRAGKLTVSSGRIDCGSGGSVCIDNRGGEVAIRGGTVTGGRLASIYSTSGGKLTIDGGTVKDGVRGIIGKDARITVSGGVIGRPDGTGVTVDISGGMLTVSGGTVHGRTDNTGGVLAVSGGTMGTLNNFAGGSAAVSGGTINGIRNAGTLSINGGMIESSVGGVRNDETGTVTVCGGMIVGSHGLENYGGSVMIRGGTVNGVTRDGITNDDGGSVIVSGGTVVGGYGINNESGGTVTMLIEEGSVIEVIGTVSRALNGTAPTIQAGMDYTGGVNYFREEAGTGEYLTITDAGQRIAAGMKAYESYIRLEADTKSGTLGDGGELRWAYRRDSGQITVIGSAVSVKEPVCAAVYARNGEMTAISLVTASGGKADIGDDFDHVKLFWMDENGAPKCESGLITASAAAPAMDKAAGNVLLFP